MDGAYSVNVSGVLEEEYPAYVAIIRIDDSDHPMQELESAVLCFISNKSARVARKIPRSGPTSSHGRIAAVSG